ncbi:MAG: hypothetical protein KA223_01955 [Candidatus Accumulibacter sp.]|nr:hypothetical protein [Accumulibacter sp.]
MSKLADLIWKNAEVLRGACRANEALYGFQVGRLSDHPLPCWRANESLVTHGLIDTQSDFCGQQRVVVNGHFSPPT